MKCLIVTLLVSIFLALSSHSVLANVLITEVHPNPLNGPEWVELYNDSNESLSPAYWWLEDQLASPSNIFSFVDQVILAHSYLVVSLSQAKLNNDKDGVTLKNATGTVIDTMSYTSTTQGLSWSRAPTSTASFVLASPTPNQPFVEPSPSPSSSSPPSPSPLPTPSPAPLVSPDPSPTPTAIPSPSPTSPPSYLYLQPSEIMACPATGEEEWLELYNPASEDVQLTNWQVRDSSDNARPVTATIPAHNFGHVSWASGLLNNTGDSVSLYTSDEQLLFTADFIACQKNTSFIFANDSWQLTTTVTLDEPNFLSSSNTPTPSPSASSLPTLLPYISTSQNKDASSLPQASENINANQNQISSILKTLQNPFTATSSLQLLTATESATVSAQIRSPALQKTQPTTLLASLLSVIMGGTVLTITHGFRLYQAYFHAQTDHLNPSRVLFP